MFLEPEMVHVLTRSTASRFLLVERHRALELRRPDARVDLRRVDARVLEQCADLLEVMVLFQDAACSRDRFAFAIVDEFHQSDLNAVIERSGNSKRLLKIWWR